MLEDVIRPLESHSSVALPELPVPFFDFTTEEIFFAQSPSNHRRLMRPPEISTSNFSEDTRFSSSSPSVDDDGHRNHSPFSVVLKPDIDFPANLRASSSCLSFNDQFDLSTLPPFLSSSSSYEEESALGYGLATPPTAGLARVSPVPCAFAANFDPEMEYLSPFPDFSGLGGLPPSGLAPVSAVEQGTAFPAMGSMQVRFTMLPPTELEVRGHRGIFAADQVQRVYSATDLQALQENQLMIDSRCGGGTSDMPAFEETRFQVGRYSLEERKQRIHRYMKKRNERNFNKKIKYACRKTLADSRPRVRGRFAKNEEFSDPIASSRSHHQYDEGDIPEDKEQDLLDSSDIFAHISGVNSLNSNYSIQSWTWNSPKFNSSLEENVLASSAHQRQCCSAENEQQ